METSKIKAIKLRCLKCNEFIMSPDKITNHSGYSEVRICPICTYQGSMKIVQEAELIKINN